MNTARRGSSASAVEIWSPTGVEEARARLMRILMKYESTCLAYSTLQRGLEYAVASESPGGGCYAAFLNYRHPLLAPRGMRLVLGEPVGVPEDWSRMCDALEAFPGRVAYLQVGRRFGEFLAGRGLPVNQLGYETQISLGDFDLAGRARQQLRQWRNKCAREEVVVEERSIDEVPRDAIKEIVQPWLARRGGRELRLLARPLVLEADLG